MKRTNRWIVLSLAMTLGSGCASVQDYSMKSSAQDQSSITATRSKGTKKTGGKPFPIYRSWTAKEHTTLLGEKCDTDCAKREYFLFLWPFDLIATLTTPFWGYEKFDTLAVKGELRGRLDAKGNPPTEIKMDGAFSAEGEWRPVVVRNDKGFSFPVERTWDLRGKSFPDSIPIRFRLPWKAELVDTGAVSRPSPDFVDYQIILSRDGTLALADSSSRTVQNLGIDIAYEKIIDRNRQEQIRLETVERNRQAQRDKPLIESLVDTYRKMIRDRLSNENMGLTGHALASVDIKHYDHEWLSEDHRRIRVWGTASAGVYIGDGQFTSPQASNWSFEATKTNGGWTIQDTTTY